MRTLYLHIGRPKTGTTYIQKVLHENRALIEAAGIGFGPYQDPQTGSHHPGFVQALLAKGAPAVLNETAACPGRNILVSAEDLLHLVGYPLEDGSDRVWGQAIRDAALRHFDLRILVFLRRQDYLMESSFFQAVRSHYAGAIADFAPPYLGLDHDVRLMQIEAIFGRGTLRVALYRDQGPNDVLGALMEMLDLDVAPRLKRDVGRQNPSMHRRKVLFLARVPKTRWSAPGFISRVVETSPAIADDGGRFVMSPRQRHALVAAYQPGNRALVARHRIADPGMFTDLPDPEAPWTPPAPATRAEIAAVFRESLRAAWAGHGPRRALGLSLRIALSFAALHRPGPAGAPENREMVRSEMRRSSAPR